MYLCVFVRVLLCAFACPCVYRFCRCFVILFDLIATNNYFYEYHFRNVDVAVWGYEDTHPFDAQAAVMQQHGLSFTLVPGMNCSVPRIF